MTGLCLPAYGKINLSLDVLGLRADGYHQLSSVMQSIKLSDELIFHLNSSGEINFTCTDPNLANEGNLVVKAARLLQERFGVEQGADIHLIKKLPVQAGLGGGSSDAAVTLRALNYLWKLGLSTSNLISLGSQLGADIAFCLVGGTVLAQGIGEKITILPPAPELWVVLVKPGVGLSAGQVYRSWDYLKCATGRFTPGVLKSIDQGDRQQLMKAMGNDLEMVVKSLVPEVEDILQKLQQEGAVKAMVSGSGPTVLGFVERQEEAEALAEKLRSKYSQIYITHTI